MTESREQQLQSILHEYLQAVDRGETPDRRAILDAHPELRGELTEYFADASRLDRMAASLRTASFGIDMGVATPLLETIRYFGDYELLEEIAKGGMGVVYRAKQVSLHRVVALKRILRGELASEADVRRFRQEAEAAANLDHPNIVPIYEVGEHESQQYFSMKLIERGDRKLDLASVAETLAKVARAVHHAHQRGILHRDLKPSNILIDKSGEPHVADFGLAKKVEGGDDATKSGVIVGTPAYMAPEQARAEKSLTTAVDVWSLGAILYEWLTGQPPFRGDDAVSTLLKAATEDPASPRSVNPKLDRDLETICLKCLEKVPTKRYGSAETLADDLERWRRGEPILARPARWTERGMKWAKRRPAIATLVGAVALVSILGVVLVVWQWRRAEDANMMLRETTKAEIAARQDADLRRDEAKSAQKQEQRQSARLALERGLALLEQGSMNQGLLWISKSMTLAPADDADFRRVAWLNLAAWYPRMHTAQWRRSVPAECMLFLGDPNLLTLGGGDGHVRCWDTSANREIWSTPTEHPVRALARSSDGKTLAAGGTHGIRLLNARDGKVLGDPIAVDVSVTSLAFHPDGNELLVGDEKQSRRVDLKTGAKIGEPMPSPNPVSSVAYSPDGGQCVTASRPANRDRLHVPGELVQRWDRETGKALGSAVDHHCGLSALRWLPDGKTPQWAPRLEIRALEFIGSAGHNLDISPDGRYLVARGFDYRAKVWDLYNGQKQIGQTIYQSGYTSTDWACFRPDGLATLSGMSDDLQLWDFAGVRRPRQVTIEGSPKIGGPAAFSPSGKVVAVWSGKTIRLFDSDTGTPLGPVLKPRNSWAHRGLALATGSDETTVLFGNPDGKAELWHARAGKLRFTFSHDAATLSAALSRDGRVALTGCTAGLARAWSLETGKQIGPDFNLVSHAEGVHLSHDGTIALGSAWSGFGLRAWTVADGKQLTLAPTGGVVDRTLISPDGKSVAASSWGDHLVRLGKLSPLTFKGLNLEHPPGDRSLAFSPDSQLLATGRGREVRLFDVATGLRVGPVLTCSQSIAGMAFSSRGDIVIAATEDGVLHRFSVPAMIDDSQGTLPVRAVLWTQLLTGMKLDAFGYAHPQDDESLGRFREEMNALGGPPANLAPTPAQILDWNRQEANENIADKRWLPAHWHLSRLLDKNPADVSARADRAVTLVAMDLPALVQADLDRLPNKGADNARLAETLGNMAQRKGKWNDAAEHYARAGEIDANNLAMVRCQVACLVLGGDADKTKKASQAINERLKNAATEPTLRFFQALALIPDLDGWDKRLERARPTWSDLWVEHAVGLVAYRANQFDQSFQRTEKSLGFFATYPGHVNSWLLMAAIEKRRGHDAEAKRWHVKATAWIDRVTVDQSPTALTPGGLDVADWLECQVLRKEIDTLMK